MKIDGVYATLDKVIQERVQDGKYKTLVYVKDFSNVLQHDHYYTLSETGIDGLDGQECTVSAVTPLNVVLESVDNLNTLVEQRKVWYK